MSGHVQCPKCGTLFIQSDLFGPIIIDPTLDANQIAVVQGDGSRKVFRVDFENETLIDVTRAARIIEEIECRKGIEK
jgi:hypothetical protein